MAYCNDTRAASGHPLFNLADALTRRVNRLAERQGMKQMLELDDHLLRDVGVTRDQVRQALDSPTAQDAETELRRLSLTQRSPWM